MSNLERNLRELRNRIGKQPFNMTQSMKLYEEELEKCYDDTRTKENYIAILTAKISKLEQDLADKDLYIEELEHDLRIALARIFRK